jgi:hypothetical protein
MPTLANVILEGTHSSRPTAEIPGRLYYETDTYKMFRDNGSTWDDVEGQGGTSASALDNIGDVSASSPNNSDVLTWSSSSGSWVASAPTLDSLTNVSVSSPNNGDILIYNSASGSWVPFINYNPDFPPSSPNAEDDEFNSTSLDAKWTESSSATSHDHSTTMPSCIYMYFSGDGGYSLSQNYAPSGAFSLTLCAHGAFQANFQMSNILVYDSTEQNGIRANLEWSGSNHQFNFSTVDGGSWTYNRATLAFPNVDKHYLHLQRDGSNNWSFFGSSDGISYRRVTSGYSKTFTIHHFKIEAAQGGATIPSRRAIEFLRRDWISI